MTATLRAVADEAVGVVGPTFAGLLPAHLRLLLLTDGKRISQVIQVLAELRIADLLVDGPLTTAQLATTTGCDPDALRRVLRAATGFGVFIEEEDGRYRNNDMSAGLISGTPTSQRELVLFNGDDMLSRSYHQLMYTVRTGRPAFPEVFGCSFFEYLSSHPEAARLFDAAMMQMSRTTGALLVEQCDLTGVGTVLDVGGGTGLFLAALLRANPSLRGCLFDLPDVVDATDPSLAAADLADRVEVRGGDFFDPLPDGFDVYLLKAVLHDWDDDAALQILTRIRQAMLPTSRLLIGEFLVGEANTWDRGKLLDVDMLLRFGGRERDLPQWLSLLDHAGFTLTNQPPQGRWAVLDCRPSRVRTPIEQEK